MGKRPHTLASHPTLSEREGFSRGTLTNNNNRTRGIETRKNWKVQAAIELRITSLNLPPPPPPPALFLPLSLTSRDDPVWLTGCQNPITFSLPLSVLGRKSPSLSLFPTPPSLLSLPRTSLFLSSPLFLPSLSFRHSSSSPPPPPLSLSLPHSSLSSPLPHSPPTPPSFSLSLSRPRPHIYLSPPSQFLSLSPSSLSFSSVRDRTFQKVRT